MHKILQLLILIILIILLVSCKNTTTPQKKKVELSLSKTLGNVTQDFFYSINNTSKNLQIVILKAFLYFHLVHHSNLLP